MFAKRAVEILKYQRRRQPFFIYLPFQSVHTPLQVPHRHFTRLNILFYRFRVQVPERYEALYSHIADGRRRVFSAMVTAMDDAVGRIVQALRRYRHYNDTLIVFTSDVRQLLKDFCNIFVIL